MKEIEVCDFRYDEGVRSRVDKQISPTLTTKTSGLSGTPMIIEDNTIQDFKKMINKNVKHQQDIIQTIEDDYSRTLVAGTHGNASNYTKILTIEEEKEMEENKTKSNLRIRKLTPKECWRLMGFDDIDFEKASQKVSQSQLYKQAGNSIVVNVLEAIFKELL